MNHEPYWMPGYADSLSCHLPYTYTQAEPSVRTHIGTSRYRRRDQLSTVEYGCNSFGDVDSIPRVSRIYHPYINPERYVGQSQPSNRMFPMVNRLRDECYICTQRRN